MELRHLRYFVAVAETLHFGRAAARLNMSQPPLSRQIRQLENEFGVLLLERTKRRVELTDAGAMMLADARRLLADADGLAERARRAVTGEIGRLSLGFVSAADYSILPGLLRRYRAEYPAVTLELRELTTDVQLRELRDGRIDAGVVLAPIDEPSLSALMLLEEPLVAALPAADPLAAGNGPLTARMLARRPFIMFPRHMAPGLHDAIARVCKDAGFVAQVAQEAIQMQTIVSLVAAGLGVALVPESIRALQRQGVVYRALRERTPKMAVLLAWRKGNRAAGLAHFIEVARLESRRFRAAQPRRKRGTPGSASMS